MLSLKELMIFMKKEINFPSLVIIVRKLVLKFLEIVQYKK